jgi:hypothetical protein
MAAKLKEKGTSITTVRDQNLSFATFPTPLLFHCPFPLSTCYEAVAEEELVELAGKWGKEAAHRAAEVPVMRP